MFISFEGIDNCGKTTQIKMLAECLQGHRLSSYGWNINKSSRLASLSSQGLVLVREPGGTLLSESIRNLLLDNKMQMNNYTELFLFEAARSELVDKVIAPALTENAIVLADRFIDSTVAYQGYGRRLDVDEIKRLNAMATNNLKPDVTFYLKIDITTANKRSYVDTNLVKQACDLDRIENAGNEFYQRVIEGFDVLAQDESDRIIIIDASQPKELVFQDVIKRLVEF